jgi:hypothetical protein
MHTGIGEISDLDLLSIRTLYILERQLAATEAVARPLHERA